MNKEFIDSSQSTIVIDENGNRTIREHKENIEEILIQENLIETLEGKRNKIIEELNSIKIKDYYLPIIPFIGEAIILFNFYFILSLIPNTTSVLETLISVINEYKIIGTVTLASFIPISLGAFIDSDYRRYKYQKKQKKGLKKKLEIIESKIQEEKEYLNRLNNEVKGQNKPTTKKVIDTNQTITEIDNLLDLYYKIEAEGVNNYIDNNENAPEKTKKR